MEDPEEAPSTRDMCVRMVCTRISESCLYFLYLNHVRGGVGLRHHHMIHQLETPAPVWMNLASLTKKDALVMRAMRISISVWAESTSGLVFFSFNRELPFNGLEVRVVVRLCPF
jgi:hypothetical protein